METAGCGSCIAKGELPFFVPMTTPRPSDTSRAKPYSVYLHKTTKFALRFYSSTQMLFCKEKDAGNLLFLWNKGAQELIFGIEGACQHDLVRTHAVFLCQLAEKAIAFHEATL